MQIALNNSMAKASDFENQCDRIRDSCEKLTKDIDEASEAATNHIHQSGDVAIKCRRDGNVSHDKQYDPPPIYILNEALLKNGIDTLPCKPRRGTLF